MSASSAAQARPTAPPPTMATSMSVTILRDLS